MDSNTPPIHIPSLDEFKLNIPNRKERRKKDKQRKQDHNKPRKPF